MFSHYEPWKKSCLKFISTPENASEAYAIDIATIHVIKEKEQKAHFVGIPIS